MVSTEQRTTTENHFSLQRQKVEYLKGVRHMTQYVHGQGFHAKIVLDSVNPAGCRLTTWELRYPRMVHCELMTHRQFSRNSSSSRAIPNERLIAQVLNDPAIPVWWGKNQSGMQAREELSDAPTACCRRCDATSDHTHADFTAESALCRTGTHDFRSDRQAAIDKWLHGRDEAVALSRRLAATGLHKQIANRVIEPWMFITVLVSSTEYDNWFALRDHPDAQPEIAWVARLMHEAYLNNKPVERGYHMPFITPEDMGPNLGDGPDFNTLFKISVGRCARVSYLTHDGRRAPDEDIALHDRLKAQTPGHWSPFEHVAMALPDASPSGNFRGWRQYRKTFTNECVGGQRS